MCLHWRARPHVITCHDVLAIRSAMGHFPENPVSVTGRMFQRLIARGLRRAGAILCVSGKTRDDLRQYLGDTGGAAARHSERTALAIQAA